MDSDEEFQYEEVPVDEDFVAPGENMPRGYKTFFMLNSAEHEISTAHNH